MVSTPTSSPDPTARTSSAALSLLAAGILWGTGGLAGTLLAQSTGMSAIPVATCRLIAGGAIATIVLAMAGGMRGIPRDRAAVRQLVIVGGLLAFYQMSYFGSVALTSVSIATLTTIGSAPVFVVAFSAIRARALPSRREMVSIAIALAGLAMLTGSPTGDLTWLGILAGTGLALLSGAGFATLTLVNSQTGRRSDVVQAAPATALGLLIGGVLLLPIGLATGLWTLVERPFSVSVVAIVCYFGAIPTALAYGLFFRGARSAGPTLAAMAAVLEPLTATVLAVVILGEKFTLISGLGAGMLAAAVLLSYLPARRNRLVRTHDRQARLARCGQPATESAPENPTRSD